MIKPDIKVECKGGGSFVTNPAVFSSDGSTIFISWKNIVLSYNTKTGKKIATYSGLTSTVIGFNVYYLDECECLTACSKNGEVKTWKISTGFKLLEKKILRESAVVQTFNILRSHETKQDNHAVCTWQLHNKISFGILKLTTGQCNKINLDLNRHGYKVSVGCNCLAVVQERKLYYINLNDPNKIWKHNISKDLHFTCVACHPEDQCLLTGDSLGRVLLWHGVSSTMPTQAVYHWHTLPVRCIAFSSSGSYFYSGGGECVLVKWQMDNSLQKNFLPRLPSTLEHISVANNNVFIALSSGDNGVRILDSRLELISVIQNLVLSESSEGNIIFDPHSKALVMNGNIGYLQFFSPYDLSLMYNLDVVAKNRITQERNCHIENIDVSKIAISKMGLWLATVEQRNEINFAAEVRLKFWGFVVAKQKFELNTSIEYPHDATVKRILFQPSNNESNLKCVTIGDNKFKIWQMQEIITPYSKGVIWKCLSVGFYKDLATNALAFSSDGSLLGVAFNHTVTTWLPDSCELKCSLLHPSHRYPLKFLEFGVGTQCHLLVSASTENVSVWNLLTLTMMWTVAVPVSLLVADSMTPYMAVFTSQGKLFVFSPVSSKLVYEADDVVEKGVTVLGATFVPSLYVHDNNLNWYQQSQLFFITTEKELYSVSSNDEVIEPISALSIDQNNSLYSLMQPKLKNSTVSTAAPTQHRFTKEQKQNTFEKVLEVPVHTMPPIRLVCKTVLASMVLETSTTNDVI